MMDDELVVLDGSTFFVSDAAGDVSGHGERGFFFADTRHLSDWRLLIDGAPLRALTSRTVDYYSARVVGTAGAVSVGVNPTVSVKRDRIVADGVHEDVFVDNHGATPCRLRVELRYGTDFADLFEVKEGSTANRSTTVQVDGTAVTFTYERAGFRRGTRLVFSVEGEIGADAAIFDVVLQPGERWGLCVDISCIEGIAMHEPRAGHGGFGQLHPQMPLSLEEWL